MKIERNNEIIEVHAFNTEFCSIACNWFRYGIKINYNKCNKYDELIRRKKRTKQCIDYFGTGEENGD